KYLAKGTHAELQMGAISGLADVDRQEVPGLLLAGMEYFPTTNRKLALDALLRNDARVAALLDAVESGKVKAAWFSEEQKRAPQGLSSKARKYPHEDPIAPKIDMPIDPAFSPR